MEIFQLTNSLEDSKLGSHVDLKHKLCVATAACGGFMYKRLPVNCGNKGWQKGIFIDLKEEGIYLCVAINRLTAFELAKMRSGGFSVVEDWEVKQLNGANGEWTGLDDMNFNDIEEGMEVARAPPKGEVRGAKRRLCFNCRKPGHLAQDCTAPRNQKTVNASRKQKVDEGVDERFDKIMEKLDSLAPKPKEKEVRTPNSAFDNFWGFNYPEAGFQFDHSNLNTCFIYLAITFYLWFVLVRVKYMGSALELDLPVYFISYIVSLFVQAPIVERGLVLVVSRTNHTPPSYFVQQSPGFIALLMILGFLQALRYAVASGLISQIINMLYLIVLKRKRIHKSYGNFWNMRGHVWLVEYLDFFEPELDQRPDSHAQADVRHRDPVLANVCVQTFKVIRPWWNMWRRTITPVISERVISLEAFSQFVSSERIIWTNDKWVNYDRILRALRNLATVNYDRYTFMENMDLLGNTASVAFLYMLHQMEKQSLAFPSLRNGTLNH